MVKRKDVNELAFSIVQQATRQKPKEHQEKDPAAVGRGRLGGIARAKALSATKRQEIARKAVAAKQPLVRAATQPKPSTKD